MRWKYEHSSHYAGILDEHGGIICEWETHDPSIAMPTDKHGKLMAMAPRMAVVVEEFTHCGPHNPVWEEAKKIMEELKE